MLPPMCWLDRDDLTPRTLPLPFLQDEDGQIIRDGYRKFQVGLVWPRGLFPVCYDLWPKPVSSAKQSQEWFFSRWPAPGLARHGSFTQSSFYCLDGVRFVMGIEIRGYCTGTAGDLVRNWSMITIHPPSSWLIEVFRIVFGLGTIASPLSFLLLFHVRNALICWDVESLFTPPPHPPGLNSSRHKATLTCSSLVITQQYNGFLTIGIDL